MHLQRNRVTVLEITSHNWSEWTNKGCNPPKTRSSRSAKQTLDRRPSAKLGKALAHYIPNSRLTASVVNDSRRSKVAQVKAAPIIHDIPVKPNLGQETEFDRNRIRCMDVNNNMHILHRCNCYTLLQLSTGLRLALFVLINPNLNLLAFVLGLVSVSAIGHDWELVVAVLSFWRDVIASSTKQWWQAQILGLAFSLNLHLSRFRSDSSPLTQESYDMILSRPTNFSPPGPIMNIRNKSR